jgi:uncharacterized protein (DUF4415 family)
MPDSKAVARDRKIAIRKASGDETKGWRKLMEEIESLRKPVKKLVRLQLDADVLAWFKESGRGYQTRINRALRDTMREGRKEGQR